jgi:hypothetical protein
MLVTGMRAGMIMMVVVVVAMVMIGMIVFVVLMVGANTKLRFDCRVRDTMLAGETLLDVADGRIRIRPILETSVERGHVLLAVQRPDVHMMNFPYTRNTGDKVGRYGVAIESARYAFQEQRAGLAHKRPGTAKKQNRHQHRQDRVDRRPAGHRMTTAATIAATEPSRSPSTCKMRAAHVEAVAVAAMQHEKGGDVYQKAEAPR